ncbi:MAG: aspartyl-phosphate phosphatase Spo0E family protein [Caldicoprobacterales bacterium]
MQTQELMEEIEKKRELLSKTIYKNGLELNNQEVLACSQELDKLIAEYLRLLSLKMVAKKRSNPVI